MKEKYKRSVTNLMNLYTVVIGLALSMSIVKLFGDNASLSAANVPSILLFVAFLATIFPFYHGALQHLDEAYIENDCADGHGALMLDFILLFVHALAFVVLSLLLPNPTDFAWVFAGLLCIDVMWGFFAHFTYAPKSRTKAELKWAIINFVTVLVIVCFIVLGDMSEDAPDANLKISVVLVSVCLLRTMIDYLWCRDFYFSE